jgi:hypothetical protein
LSLTLREKHRLKVFENRVLRRISGPKRDEIIGGCRKQHNKKLRNVYSSPNVFRMTKSRNVKLAGNVVSAGRRGMRIQFWWESQMEIDH